VTKVATHKAFRLTTLGNLTFGGRIGVYRVETRYNSDIARHTRPDSGSNLLKHAGTNKTTPEATQGQIVRHSPTDSTSGRWLLNGR